MAEIPEWLKSDGLSDEEIEKLKCPNGSFTCGLRAKLGFEGKCNLCKKEAEEKKSLSDKWIRANEDEICGDMNKFYLKDVKEAIKEFIEKIVTRKIESSEIINEQAKEIFGDRLI